MAEKQKTVIVRRKADRRIAPETSRATHQQIARRAYQLYEDRGKGPQRDVDDWLRAEQELNGR